LPHPPTMSGVAPISVIDSPMAMASTAIDRMIHLRLAAGSGVGPSGALTGAFSADALVFRAFVSDGLPTAGLPALSCDVLARGAVDVPPPPGG
jgi:hypothetical protein